MISALVSAQDAIQDLDTETGGGGLGFISISWAGKVPGVSGDGKGSFIITADQIEGRYDDVLKDWNYGKVFIGSEMKEAYFTDSMTCVPVAWRTCWVKYDAGRRVVGRWGKFTKRTPDMAGSKTNTQVILYLPSLNDYALLGLSGVSKTVAWDNDQKNPRYSSFPLGIQQKLKLVSDKASEALTKQHGSKIRVVPNMTFIVDFVNLLDDDGNPKIFAVGSGDKTSNMFAPTIYADPDSWETLYVGDGMYSKFVDMYVEKLKDWVAEWPAEGAIDSNVAPKSEPSRFNDEPLAF